MTWSLAVNTEQNLEMAPFLMAAMFGTLVMGAAAEESAIVTLFPVDIQWIGPDGNVVLPSEDIAISREGFTSFLQFQPAQQSHEGRYTCQAVIMETNFSAASFVLLDEIISKELIDGVL